ncbi:hypothetical protein R1flu_001656 [Riccia fluitans]|uniref:Uncharacterized protein n=1 Tax=Riccia fluitans TaxID=41844 RepID=A0ABD1Y478_9MARC
MELKSGSEKLFKNESTAPARTECKLRTDHQVPMGARSSSMGRCVPRAEEAGESRVFLQQLLRVGSGDISTMV